ncbi:GlcNAc-PI de-N-acetylase [Pigmentiphaga humi]|uniref:GlcNAc-PI de-N-acetylase n=1 Tax=Pigmentiphaga humi TaxID=2478468 RepID=A0A3P4B1Q0_9BURK|nr:PIG-L family deacetylase [Pigmentiphaga humi]VCU69982.1 GlcNAc-PI de-N-acetylase [Pigmentiphaga humi]
MEALAAPGPLIAVSPHLDDAVFSCGDLLGLVPGSLVVTVFAGIPDEGPPTEWDRRCGFGSGAEAMRARREEDARALDRLGARPVWLDLLDAQYGARCTPRDAAQSLAAALDRLDGRTVLAPLGLFHSDHVLAHDACMLLCRTEPARTWLLYEDALYRRHPGRVQRRLAALLSTGIVLTPAAGPPAGSCAKRRAVQAYASQLRAFGEHGYDDTRLPERYWTVENDDRR